MDKVQASEILAKHLPPSAADLNLLDVNGELGEYLQQLRPDVHPQMVPGYIPEWSDDVKQASSVDSVVAWDYVLNEQFLLTSLDVLRPGGRLIILNAVQQDLVDTGNMLETLGYVRILVEELVIDGVEATLIRGEKPHTYTNTVDRIQQVAQQDDQLIDWSTYRGRFVNLLILRTPNLPPWKMDETVQIEWQAAALATEQPKLLGFSSLPRAVGFLQPTVMQGKIKDVNHVAKFKKNVIAAWEQPILLNPSPEILDSQDVTFIHIDPEDAEAPDE